MFYKSKLFAQNAPAISAFSHKEFKEDDEGTLSFDVYFNGEMAATFTIDLWTNESDVTYTSASIKDAMTAHARENGLFDEVKTIYRERQNYNDEVIVDKTFTLSDVIQELGVVFFKIEEEKQALAMR